MLLHFFRRSANYADPKFLASVWSDQELVRWVIKNVPVAGTKAYEQILSGIAGYQLYLMKAEGNWSLKELRSLSSLRDSSLRDIELASQELSTLSHKYLGRYIPALENKRPRELFEFWDLCIGLYGFNTCINEAYERRALMAR